MARTPAPTYRPKDYNESHPDPARPHIRKVHAVITPVTPAANRRRTTRADVARLAGVSTATVSYVLNGDANKVSEETAQRVLDAARKLDYRPNGIARALKTGRTHMLGIVVPDITNPYFGELVEQFEHVATEYGHSLVVNLSHGLADIERTRVEELSDRDVDAIFLSPAQTNAELGALIRQGKRIVVLDHTAAIPGMKTVSTDFMQASYAITTHLLEHGRRRTVMLFGDEAALSDQRVMGWIQAHRDLGLPAGPVRQSDFTREGAYQIMAELLALPANERPDAVFAASDLEALGALRAIHEAGLRIPDDIAIISFDGTAETLYTWPQLTTTKQDTAQIARCAIDAALNPDSAPDVQLVPAELVIRQSCGCR